EKLRGFAAGQDGIDHVFRGKIKQNKGTSAIFAADEDMQKAIDSWMIKGKYPKLLDLWVKGVMIDWDKLYGSAKRRKVSLPTYPFAKERYWVDKVGENNGNNRVAPAETSVIHPLLHRNTSDLSEQRFTSTFTGKEFFVENDMANGRRIVPGAAYLEMARAAVEHGGGAWREEQAGIRLKDIVWAQPAVVRNQPVQVNIGLFPEENGEIAYEIYSDEPEKADAKQLVYSQGIVVPCQLSKAPALDIQAVQKVCSRNILAAEGFKAGAAGHDLTRYGIESVHTGEGQILAKLCLPSPASDTESRFILHPGLINSALKASAVLTTGTVDDKPRLPLALQELEIFSTCTSKMWAFIRYSNGGKAEDIEQKFDIDLCDDNGMVCVRMK
ncbi:polyketide synthase dehydratase domain-containing protein, partial [Paenibacillus sp. 1-18]|uniref:polyketide synthase dehydratase domain-containing protein n=1 Tax=Paenibacillus sp. 1-18 TaxID=1333846 RepID=UPI0012DF2E66